MFEVIHKTQGSGERSKYKYVDIYVKDLAEAMKVKKNKLVQGSKLFIVETASLYVLNEDEGVWCSAVDGTVLGEA
ncbi:MAG: hypothetical protein E7645_00220 [Ruminococcaceae bacterium]|nr:hypothetical protein [Oscillospiraceae bacterium]